MCYSDEGLRLVEYALFMKFYREGIAFIMNINMYRNCKILIRTVGCNEEYKLNVVISNMYQVGLIST